MISKINYDRITALDDLENDDPKAEKLGHTLAAVLCLRPAKRLGVQNRYHTQWGPKTAAGVARTVLSIIEGSNQP